MHGASTTCKSSTSTSRVTSSISKENIRRQIVGLAVNRDFNNGRLASFDTDFEDNTSINLPFGQALDLSPKVDKSVRRQATSLTPRKAEVEPVALSSRSQDAMIRTQKQEVLKTPMRRSKTTLNAPFDTKPPLAKPKMVRFRMDEHSIAGHKVPLVNIRAVSPGPPNAFRATVKTDVSGDYGIRGNAMAVRKEGLRGLVDYKELCTEDEKRQNSLQASLKIFRRRIKLNQEKFIQPNESTSEDYVIHTSRTPFCDVGRAPPSPVPPPGDERPDRSDQPTLRPLSSDEHVRILKSALHNRHHGANGIVKPKETDNFETDENFKNIKCSYRLPENPNWSKEVSFKDIKDDTIPSVKTYVLQEDRCSPHAKYKKNNVQNAVTLNIHNLSVHNSITQVNGHKMKVGEGEVTFDPRFVDWLEDSLSNSKALSKSTSFVTDDTLETCPTPSVKRRAATKT